MTHLLCWEVRALQSWRDRGAQAAAHTAIPPPHQNFTEVSAEAGLVV